jgi:hypothetical protein
MERPWDVSCELVMQVSMFYDIISGCLYTLIQKRFFLSRQGDGMFWEWRILVLKQDS